MPRTLSKKCVNKQVRITKKGGAKVKKANGEIGLVPTSYIEAIDLIA